MRKCFTTIKLATDGYSRNSKNTSLLEQTKHVPSLCLTGHRKTINAWHTISPVYVILRVSCMVYFETFNTKKVWKMMSHGSLWLYRGKSTSHSELTNHTTKTPVSGNWRTVQRVHCLSPLNFAQRGCYSEPHAWTCLQPIFCAWHILILLFPPIFCVLQMQVLLYSPTFLAFDTCWHPCSNLHLRMTHKSTALQV